MSIETEVFYLIQTLRTPLLNEAMVATTALGSAVFAAVLIVGLYISGEKKFARVSTAAALLNGFVVYGMKMLIDRPRPEIIEPLATTFTNYSFPSGHASVAFMLAALLSARKPEARLYFFTLAALVGFSRIYLGIHYPSDVIAGAVTGVLSAKLILEREAIRGYIRDFSLTPL